MQQIFYNAKVHTFAESGFEADAFLVNDGSIVLVGSKDEVLPHLSEIYSTCTVLEEVE